MLVFKPILAARVQSLEGAAISLTLLVILSLLEGFARFKQILVQPGRRWQITNSEKSKENRDEDNISRIINFGNLYWFTKFSETFQLSERGGVTNKRGRYSVG